MKKTRNSGFSSFNQLRPFLSRLSEVMNSGSLSFGFPIPRKVFPSTFAHELLSIQPMSVSVGSVFYIDQNHILNKKIKLAGLKKKAIL